MICDHSILNWSETYRPKLDSLRLQSNNTGKLSRNIVSTHFPIHYKYIIAQLYDVTINISIRVSLQWFKLNRKISATKITHNESVRNVEQVFVTESPRSHMKSRLSWRQPDKNRSKAIGIQLDPAHNGKIINSIRSTSSNAITGFIWMTAHPDGQKS